MLTSFLNCGSLFSLDRHHVIVGFGRKKYFKTLPSSTPAFYFPDFFLQEQTPWFIHESYQALSINQLRALISVNTDMPIPIDWNLIDKTGFEKSFEEVKTLFTNTSLQKIVLYSLQNSDQLLDLLMLKKMLNGLLDYIGHFPAKIYGSWEAGEGILGATPETLFKLGQKERYHLETQACAGTAGNPIQAMELLKATKENQEHDLVIAGIRESLSPFGAVEIGNKEVIQFKHLHHLITPIHVRLYGPISFEELIFQLHPTPALGGYPRAESLSWLKNYDKSVPRRKYGAPAALSFDEKISCEVAIRNIQWNPSGLSLGAGCGVTVGSDLEDEWNEIKEKLNAIKSILNFS